jgi:hypothetical protein
VLKSARIEVIEGRWIRETIYIYIYIGAREEIDLLMRSGIYESNPNSNPSPNRVLTFGTCRLSYTATYPPMVAI